MLGNVNGTGKEREFRGYFWGYFVPEFSAVQCQAVREQALFQVKHYSRLMLFDAARCNPVQFWEKRA